MGLKSWQHWEEMNTDIHPEKNMKVLSCYGTNCYPYYGSANTSENFPYILCSLCGWSDCARHENTIISFRLLTGAESSKWHVLIRFPGNQFLVAELPTFAIIPTVGLYQCTVLVCWSTRLRERIGLGYTGVARYPLPPSRGSPVSLVDTTKNCHNTTTLWKVSSLRYQYSRLKSVSKFSPKSTFSWHY